MNVEGHDCSIRFVGRDKFNAIEKSSTEDASLQVDRHRKAEPTGVVGVVANDIDAARGDRGDVVRAHLLTVVGVRRGGDFPRRFRAGPDSGTRPPLARQMQRTVGHPDLGAAA